MGEDASHRERGDGPAATMAAAALPFAAEPTPSAHFELCYYLAVSVVIEQLAAACDGRERCFAEFPFLRRYWESIAGSVPEGRSVRRWWGASLAAWEERAAGRLPIRALRAASGFGEAELAMLFTVGLAAEDPSFGVLFEAAQAIDGERRPTAGLLGAWWRSAYRDDGGRNVLRQLRERGLVVATETAASRGEQALEIPALLWETMRGEVARRPFAGTDVIEHADLPRLSDLVLDEGVRRQLDALSALLAAGRVTAVAVRGPRRNSRQTVLAGVARALGQRALVIDAAAAGSDPAATLAGPVATMIGAMPILRYDLTPGETVALPDLAGYAGPVGVVLGRYGGLEGERAERLLTVALDLPDGAARRRHWEQATGGSFVDAGVAAERLRLTGGNIRRVAQLAPAYAALDGRPRVTLADARRASSALNRQALDTLATHVPASGNWEQLAVRAETRAELLHLARRCRHRERLAGALGPAFRAERGQGIRALFSGPSGTGKTLAARLLAADLEVDLYRIDLSAVVNKYVGETEKNLSRLFTLAEELDVMLLLDEGDALLGQRGAVNSATDRYANLEVNFLLQRLESFDGMLIVTTNASDRIDGAFERRLDVVVKFQPPEADERSAIWALHLAADHAVPPETLRQVSAQYRLAGGQIRNAALHAALLALDDGGRVTTGHLDRAIQREYRKLGRVAPALSAGLPGDDGRSAGDG